ncbi:hypothetical protein ASF38_03070 [Aeromicrobium sp. Leaf272]|nr:hypothetical protein ASF38_03070 [Aeromicrobium sp. Leaf272]
MIRLPTADEGMTSFERVAPAIATPSAYQRYRTVMPFIHVPRLAVNVLPLAAAPEMRGTAAAVTTRSVDADVAATVGKFSLRPVTRTLIRRPP